MRNEKLCAVCVEVLPENWVTETSRPYLKGTVTGNILYVSVERLRGFELHDIYFQLDDDDGYPVLTL